MGRFLVCLFMILSVSLVKGQSVQVRDTLNVPVMEFVHNSYSFGDMVQGAKVTHEYKFKNTGNIPLVIANVLVTCGCTVPEWPKTPIPPNKTGSIKVFFNSSGKLGVQNKTITILTNTKKGRETVMFTANVLAPKQ